VDLSPSDPFGLREYVKIDNMMNPPEISNGNVSASGGAEVTRYHFHLDTGSVEATGFPNLLNGDMSRYVNQFDFPTINEAYRGKEVCNYFLHSKHQKKLIAHFKNIFMHLFVS
jgi:hypothetical protein